jgi:hypothetical protein
MKQSAIKYGIIAGTAIVLYLLFFYWMNPVNATSRWVSFGTLLFVFAGMVAATARERSLAGGQLERRQALKVSFSVAVISGIFFYGFLYLLFNYIDPGLNNLLLERAKTENPDITLAQVQMTPEKVFFGYAFSLVYGFLLALMVANFGKKTLPDK